MYKSYELQIFCFVSVLFVCFAFSHFGYWFWFCNCSSGSWITTCMKKVKLSEIHLSSFNSRRHSYIRLFRKKFQVLPCSTKLHHEYLPTRLSLALDSRHFYKIPILYHVIKTLNASLIYASSHTHTHTHTHSHNPSPCTKVRYLFYYETKTCAVSIN